MALLDQLFRLRGAPRYTGEPVTLGALVAALNATNSAAGSSASARSNLAEPEPSPDPKTVEQPIPAPLSPPEPPRPAPRPERDPNPEPTPPNPANDSPPEPNRSSDRGNARFNPFAPAGEQTMPARGVGPCLDDPTLPPLRLQARVTDPAGGPVILGAIAPSENGNDSPELRQVGIPFVRLAPIKVPPRDAEMPPPASGRPLLLRLEIQAEPGLDVVAFKQHAAAFPGVVKCVISNAGD